MKKLSITEKVKSFEDACKLLGIGPENWPVEKSSEKDRSSIFAYYQLILITRALNEGWEPNWKDWNEQKWYNYFYFNSASGFVYSDTGYSVANASIGSRLCFKSEELAAYAFKQFKQLYLEYLLIDIPDSSQVE